jgi:truncated hemoglobin YjbI
MNQNEWIFRVVDAFYQKAKTDILIGYHFRIIADFDEHIPRIASFWELQLFGKASRELKEPFDLIKVHIPLGIKRGELGRWLLLFRKTLKEETLSHPEFEDLSKLWEEKLQHFEKIFMRFFNFS